MTASGDESLVREATRILLRLKEDPENDALLKERDAFLARGAAERAAYDEVLRAWKLTGGKRRPKTLYVFVLLGTLLASLYLASGPARIYLLADFRTGLERAAVTLDSGDRAEMDARSALVDETEGDARRVTLLQGAAFFEVDTRERPFAVSVGSLTIRALGTAFETARIDDIVLVAVAEGEVEILTGVDRLTLEAGEQLRWSPKAGAAVDAVEPGAIAAWRQDWLITDGLTFEQVADVIDRRLQSRIVILDDELAQSRILGGLDLGDPALALRTLAAAEGARVVTAPPFVSLILR
ncbi:MAG: FecR domain-containing protein [Pseudomonadota bacterium]